VFRADGDKAVTDQRSKQTRERKATNACFWRSSFQCIHVVLLSHIVWVRWKACMVYLLAAATADTSIAHF
jgi:hypothetical protein